MILKALYDLAVARGSEIREDPDFSLRPVHFLIRFDAQGKYLGLESLLDDKGKARSFPAPRVPERTVAVAPAFLADNAQYTLRLSKEGGKNDTRGAQCAAAFDQLVEQAAHDTKDEALRGLAKLLTVREQWAPLVLQAAEEHLSRGKDGAIKWDGKDVFTFAFVGDSGWIQDRAAAREWWKQRRQSSASGKEGSQIARCLVTEQLAPVTDLHAGIKGVPNTGTTGAKIVSFNSEAVVSWGYGTNEGGNAPTSREGAEGYAAALNWLLARTGQRPHRQGVRLGPESVVVFWTREESGVVDLLLGFDTPSGDDMRAVLQSPWKGTEKLLADPTAFYALTLGGNRSRVVVRDWFTSTAGDVAKNLRVYFDDLRLEPLDGEGEAPVPLAWLLKSLQARPRSKQGQGDLSADLSARLFQAAVSGGALPLRLLPAALDRLRLPPDRDAYLPGGALTTLRLRCALLKATLNRHHRHHPELSTDWSPLTVSLDEKNNSVPYVLGRLFAVLESAQAEAVGKERDVNATIRDRYFGTASSAPGLVFPTLLDRFSSHAARLRKDGKPWSDLEVEALLDLLSGKPYPRTFNLEERGVFSVGYYHQRAHSRRRAIEGKARKDAARQEPGGNASGSTGGDVGHN